MKFNVSSTTLFAQLQSVSRVIASKNNKLPILDSILFDLQGQTLTLSASDEETTIRTSLEVENAEGAGKVAFDAKLLLGINNPAMSFAVQEVTGTIRYKQKPIAHFVTGGIELQGKTDQVYELPCTVELAEGASLLDILVIASKRSLDGLKADVSIQAALKKNGVLRAPFTFEDLDISSFTK